MRPLLTVFVIGVLMAPLPANASAILSPQATLLVNNENVPIPGEWVTDDGGKHWRFRSAATPAAVSPLEFLTGEGNIDPFLNYSVGFVNPFSSTTTYVLTILMPYVGGPYNEMTLSHSSTVTDSDSSGAATVSLDADAHVANAVLDAVVTTGLGTGCAMTPPPNPQTCFSGPDSTVAVASAASGVFGIRLNFQLSANDSYSTTGRVDLANAAAVPEPTTVMLVATAMVATLRRRRIRTRWRR
jgi:hypothetical protein